MTYLQTLADLLRDLAHRLDPYKSPPPVLPKPGDRLTVVIRSGDDTWTTHAVVNVVQGDIESGQAVTRIVVREVEG